MGSGLVLQQSLSPVSGRERPNEGNPQHVLMKVTVISQAPLGHGTCPLESEMWSGNTNDPCEAGPIFLSNAESQGSRPEVVRLSL